MRGLRSIDWLIQEADLEKISIGEQYFPNKVKNNKKMLSCKDFPSISTSGLMYLLIFIDWYWLIYWFFIVKKRALFRTSLCFYLFFVSSKKKKVSFPPAQIPPSKRTVFKNDWKLFNISIFSHLLSENYYIFFHFSFHIFIFVVISSFLKQPTTKKKKER